MLHVVDGDVLQRVFGDCLLYFANLNGAQRKGAEARAVACVLVLGLLVLLQLAWFWRTDTKNGAGRVGA